MLFRVDFIKYKGMFFFNVVCFKGTFNLLKHDITWWRVTKSTSKEDQCSASINNPVLMMLHMVPQGDNIVGKRNIRLWITPFENKCFYVIHYWAFGPRLRHQNCNHLNMIDVEYAKIYPRSMFRVLFRWTRYHKTWYLLQHLVIEHAVVKCVQRTARP